MSGTLPENTAMATDTAAQEPLQMGVGILEGFGLPDSQTDIGAASADAAPKTAVSEQAGEAAGQAQTSGQFARMLEQEQPGMAAADMPQQPNAELESIRPSEYQRTGRARSGNSGDERDRQLQSKLAPARAAEAQTETQITARSRSAAKTRLRSAAGSAA